MKKTLFSGRYYTHTPHTQAAEGHPSAVSQHCPGHLRLLWLINPTLPGAFPSSR